MATIEERVVNKIRHRKKIGHSKYGVGMERVDLTPRDWMQHAQEEALDFAIYLEKLMELWPN